MKIEADKKPTHEEIRYKAEEEIGIALGNWQINLEIEPGDIAVDDEDYISVGVMIYFEYGNCKHEHLVNFGWDIDDGYGVEVGEDCELHPVSATLLWMTMYYDLATEGLEDQYML